MVIIINNIDYLILRRILCKMTLMAGNILEGTVVNITNFGAFVEIEGKTGLVHISEVADSFVKDIRQHLNEQDKVKVKVISIDDNGKIRIFFCNSNIDLSFLYNYKYMDFFWNFYFIIQSAFLCVKFTFSGITNI